MANISVERLYERAKDTCNTMGGGTGRFDRQFVQAVNDAASRINRGADLETRITRINGPTGTFALSDAYEDVVMLLVLQGLRMMGKRVRKEMIPWIEKQMAEIDDKIDDIRQDILNQAVTADTDDETDYVGLGALNES
jgi:hypothetical protein